MLRPRFDPRPGHLATDQPPFWIVPSPYDRCACRYLCARKVNAIDGTPRGHAIIGFAGRRACSRSIERQMREAALSRLGAERGAGGVARAIKLVRIDPLKAYPRSIGTPHRIAIVNAHDGALEGPSRSRRGEQ